VKKLLFASTLLGLLFLMLTACQNKPDETADPQDSLPPPQVRVGKIPTATPTATATPEPEGTPTPEPTATTQVQIQVWPTLDAEAYWQGEIETLISRIERRLNSVDTRLKP
jgi:hypothetical protein